jgi:acetyl-CoA carboxylase carboxyl transferase subunit beta
MAPNDKHAVPRRLTLRRPLAGGLAAGRVRALNSLRAFEQTVLRRGLRRPPRARCEHCGMWLDRGGECSPCGLSRRLGAQEWIDLVADRGTFRLFSAVVEADPLRYVEGASEYAALLAEARERTGAEESVTAGYARIGGTDAVLAVFDFRFLGGSLGVAAGDRITAALLAATRERVPAVLVVCSSGARMQEGLPSLYQMIRTSSAAVELRRAGLPLVAVLADPTTGAAYASCASLADVILAERHALINFAGPRVVEAVTGEREEALRAEELLERGMLDRVVPRVELAGMLADVLRLLARRRPESSGERVELAAPKEAADRWELLLAVREPGWPTGVQWLRSLMSESFQLHGDRAVGDDPALVCALAELDGVHLLVLATERRAGTGLITAAGYRKARRALTIAARLGLPVLSLVDGPGAAVGRSADESGIASALAECFASLLEHPAPTLTLLVGEGNSGGAIALAATDRQYMLERSTFSVISPEGAAAILDRLGRPASEWATTLRIAAADAFALGLVDGVIGGDGRKQVKQARRLIVQELARLALCGEDELLAARRRRYLEATRPLLHRADSSHPGPTKEDAA